MLGFMAFLLFMASRPDSAFFEPFGDKLLHGLAYFVLGVLALRAFHGGVVPLRPLPTVCALVLTLGYAALEEWAQTRVPARHPSRIDWAADAVGAICSLGFSAVVGWFAGRIRKE